MTDKRLQTLLSSPNLAMTVEGLLAENKKLREQVSFEQMALGTMQAVAESIEAREKLLIEEVETLRAEVGRLNKQLGDIW